MKKNYFAFVTLMLCGIALAAPPQPPTNITAVAGNGSATVSWTPPQDTGGSPIVAYTANAVQGKKCSANKNRRSCKISGLKNQAWYTFDVVAKNKDGSSISSSESNIVIPFARNVDAQCGTANNIYNPNTPNPSDLCLIGGGPAPIKMADGLYHWTCAGLRQGSTAFCRSAPYTPPKVKVGDKGPAGGKVFYVTPDGYHGMEAAPALETNNWGCNSFVGSTDTAVGRGEENTRIILLKCPEADSAARMADNFVLNGYTDWFLPSKDEMGLLAPLTDVAKGKFWTSSELGASTATIWSRDLVLCSGGGGWCYGPFTAKSEVKYWISFSSLYIAMFHPVRAF